MTFVVGVKSVGHARTLAQRMCEFADDARMSIRRIYCLRWLTQEARATFIAGVTKDRRAARHQECPTGGGGPAASMILIQKRHRNASATASRRGPDR
jgi:hypothetical protein